MFTVSNSADNYIHFFFGGGGGKLPWPFFWKKFCI